MGSLEPIYYWRYTLKSRAALNAVSERTEHEGALIKIGEGHACIHPWPELGDKSLDEQLKLLSAEQSSTLIIAAKDCAKMDGYLRMEGLTANRIFPESHWLVRQGDDPQFAKSEGFEFAKIKGTPDAERTRGLLREWSGTGLKVRLDFNECLEVGEFLPYWNELSSPEREGIDFIEDPEKWTSVGWKKIREAGVPLAVDRDSGNRASPGDVIIAKPARPDWFFEKDARVVVTSYMDHPIGQMYAAVRASDWRREMGPENLLTCGLLTHRCFEDDEFIEQIRCDGPRLLPVEGTGLGFDDLLEKLPWKCLS